MIASRLADGRERREVVGDEDHRQPEVALELLEQLEHLGLHHHVERRGRLVGDQQAGLHASASAISTRWR